MRISRRRLLQITSVSALASLLGFQPFRLFGFQPFRPEPLSRPEQATLAAFLDVLIPADESPSATELNTHLKIFQRAENEVSYWLILRQGGRWLDKRAQEAGKPAFPALTPQQRGSIVAQATNPLSDPSIRLFVQTVRDDAFRIYYADPRSWASLAYFGPPQPLGFLDYQEPPRKARRS